MTIQRSTGFCNKVIQNAVITPANAIFGTAGAPTVNAMNLRIYGGTVPATADAAASTLLCTITGPAAAALTWSASAVAGVLAKSAQVWSGTVTGAGTQNATYFRFVASDDTDASSSTYPRLQGIVSTAGAELDLSSVAQVNGATTTINSASLAMTPN